MNTKALFVTGTNTDIGKTYVSAGICCNIAEQFQEKIITYLKPLATGVDPISEDIEFVRNNSKSFQNLNCSYLEEFKEPASPFMAAKCEGKDIEYISLIDQTLHLISQNDFTLVEGAGGLLVPITEEKMMLDFMVDLKIPVLIVSHFNLGTVNHTLLTIDRLKQEGVLIVGVVLNQPEDVDRNSFEIAVKSNAHEIERVSGIPVLGQLKFGEKFESLEFKKIVKKTIEYLS